MVNCCVIGCKSRSERNQPNITFHRFPSDPILKNKWTECTGRLNWHPSRHSRICSRHFTTNCFLKKKNSTCLIPRSIPTLFIQIQQKLNLPSTSKCETMMDLDPEDCFVLNDSPVRDDHLILPLEEIDKEQESTSSREVKPLLPAPEDEITPRKKKLLKKLEKTIIIGENRRKKLAALRSKTWRLQKKTAEQSTVIAELKSRSLINQHTADLLSSIDVTNRDFLKKFLCKNTTERKYTTELRKFALSLHYISPKAYIFVRNQL